MKNGKLTAMRAAGWAVVTLALGCSAPAAKVKNGSIERTINGNQIAISYIEAIGIGAADPSMTNETQRMATSREAAIAAAQNQLLGLISGVHVSGGVTVKQAIESDSNIKNSVDGILKGAQIVKTEWTRDDGCVITIRVSKQALEKAVGAQIFKS